ncbi:MAG: dipeptide ABC transporter ATP-binding protein DppD, partial [Planctomycetes bacterium]|nr:dipeptide ABC transporter ATP-binding protein DppD [Planctomycetota bacterium]
MTEPRLAVGGLAVTFKSVDGPVAAVRGINLEVARAKTLALVGESGCGKS